MTRELDTKTLGAAGRDYAAQFLLPTIANPRNPAFAPIGGRGWVMNSLYNLHFKDEFDYVRGEMRGWMGPKALAEFDDLASKTFTPRSEEELRRQLAERLAVTPDGKPIPGKIGLVQKGQVVIGWRMNRRGQPRVVKADVHVGETPEESTLRVAKHHADNNVPIFPMTQWPFSMMALNTRISNEAALGACDYVVGRLDEGSGAAILRLLTGTQAVDPDTAIGAQVTLALLVCTNPAFPAAVDLAPGARATASAIVSDSSADATGTCTWVRGSATNDGATSLDDHIDGEAGTSGADFNFNTVAIVSGATVALSSWSITMPES